MKKIQLSISALMISSSFVMAGGDIVPLTHYEVEDIKAAEIVEVVEVKKTPVVVKLPKVVTKKPLAIVLGSYIGAGLIAIKYNPNCNCTASKGKDKTAGLMVRIGYDFNKYFGVESRAMRSNWKSNGGKIKHAGLFIKPMYPISNDINIYGLAGYAKTTTQGKLRRMDVNGVSFGLGFEYDLSSDSKKDTIYNRKFDGIGDQENGLGLFVDYERLFYKSGSPDLDAISAGITYDF